MPGAPICRPRADTDRNPTSPKGRSFRAQSRGAKTMGGGRPQFGPHARRFMLGTTPCARRQRSADRMLEDDHPPSRSPDPRKTSVPNAPVHRTPDPRKRQSQTPPFAEPRSAQTSVPNAPVHRTPDPRKTSVPNAPVHAAPTRAYTHPHKHEHKPTAHPGNQGLETPAPKRKSGPRSETLGGPAVG